MEDICYEMILDLWIPAIAPEIRSFSLANEPVLEDEGYFPE